MKAIQDLRMEHDAVRLTLEVLERIAQKIEQQGTPEDPRHAEQLLAMGVQPVSMQSTRRRQS
jgi:hypothetical protein